MLLTTLFSWLFCRLGKSYFTEHSPSPIILTECSFGAHWHCLQVPLLSEKGEVRVGGTIRKSLLEEMDLRGSGWGGCREREKGILGERNSMNKSQGRQTRRPMGKAGCTVWALEALERFLSHVA